jgi:hypothetical protein
MLVPSPSHCALRPFGHPSVHPRDLCCGGDPAIFLCSHVPMKRFFWWDRSRKFKNTRPKGTEQENSKKQEGKNGRKKKKRFYFYFFKTFVEVPILVCSPSVGNALRLLPSCNPPSGEPTHTGTSPTTCHPSQHSLSSFLAIPYHPWVESKFNF